MEMKPAVLLLPAVIMAQSILPALALQLEVDGGNHVRKASVVTIQSPTNAAPGTSGYLRSEDGKISLPCQFDSDGKLTFVAPSLEPHQKLKLSLTVDKDGIAQQAVTAKDSDSIQLNVRGKNVAAYQTTARTSPREDLDPKYLRGGYLHPLVTPSGKIVTDDYPIDHLHHHGIWTAWTKTRFDGREPDFWNMGQGKGKVDFVSLGKSWSGPVEAGLTSFHKFTDLASGSPVDVLDEAWTIRTYDTGEAYHIIDLDSIQTTTGNKPLELPIYHYGGLGIRGREEWNGKDKATFITSENLTDRNKANSQPARWISMSGAVEGGTAGFAILSHPENFRAPQPVRIHPSEPFISLAPQTKEAMSIKSGEAYHSRYRFIIFDGEADAKLIEQLWQDYAHPVTATWTK
jgi:hypothetical protein